MDSLGDKLEDLGLSRLPAAPASHTALPDPWKAPCLAVFKSVAACAGGAGVPVPPLPAWNPTAIVAYAKELGWLPMPTAAPQPLLAIDFVVSTLQAMRMVVANKATAAPLAAPASVQSEEEVFTRHLAALGKLLQVPGSVTRDSTAYLRQIHSKLQVLLRDVAPDAITPHEALVSPASLTPGAMELLHEINDSMHGDYALRRRMLLERIDVTVQSFLWSPKAHSREGEIMAAVEGIRRELDREDAAVRVADVFSTGPEAVRLRGSTRDEASVKSVIIGVVPDRGGRAGEMRPKARDLMPAWQARKAGGDGGRGRGGRGRGGRGAGGNRGGRGPKPQGGGGKGPKSQQDGGGQAAPAAAGGGGRGGRGKGRRRRGKPGKN